MTDDTLTAPFVRVRDELPPVVGLDGPDQIRGTADSRRRRRATAFATAGVLATVVGVLLVPQLLDDAGSRTVATSAGTDSERLRFTLPVGWTELAPLDARTSCVGPRHGVPGSCPVEIVVAPDPTAVSPVSKGITDVTDACRPGEEKRITVSTRSAQRPTSTFRGGCGSGPLTTTVVALDSGAVFVRTAVPELALQLEAFVDTFVLPEGWVDVPGSEDAEVGPDGGDDLRTDPSEGMSLATEDFPVNSRGLTYGSDAEAGGPNQGPDLVAVLSDDGRAGYVYADDLMGPTPDNPSEAAAWQESQRGFTTMIPVYDQEGQTRIGWFTLS